MQEDGLSQNTINCVIEDRKGSFWIGTFDGLNRYDGSNFEIFIHEPFDSISISDSYIISLFKSISNEIWIGTELGLNLYDYKQDKFINYFHDLFIYGYITVSCLQRTPSFLSQNLLLHPYA